MQEVQKQWIVQWGNVSIKMWLFCFCNGIAGECSRPNGLVGVGWLWQGLKHLGHNLNG
jgi:hypothetical protein